MEKELIDHVRRNNLSPFNRTKTQIKSNDKTSFKTKDAKAVHTKVLNSIASNFAFADTANFFSLLSFTENEKEIKNRQNFFKSIEKNLDNDFLKNLKLQRTSWKPPYGIVVVTEDEKTFVALQKMNAPVKILLTEQDVSELADVDVIQVIDCENFSRVLERLPQTIFLKNVNEAYVESYVELLSQWQEILRVSQQNELDAETKNLVAEISNLLPLLEKRNSEKITREQVENALENVKEEIGTRIAQLTVSGNSLIEIISKGSIPAELKNLVKEAIAKTKLPSEFFLSTIPVQLDENEVEKFLRKQSLTEFTSIAEKIKSKSKELLALPAKLRMLEERLLVYDFKSGVSQWMQNKTNFPTIEQKIQMNESKNLFLPSPQPVTFFLDAENRCSMLTGANSGGKTTLLEHLLQAISCLQLGLPVDGQFSSPLFSEIYYFAKNKGSISKGAFETLLTQMSGISPGKKTLILADEIEAVTEPGVAGKMISATAEYFINKNCFLVIATHLGHEIQKNLPKHARIDGIEAVGLDEQNELIVNHNPVIGKLAHSTPELIIEKMVKTQGGEYFEFLHQNIIKK